MEKENFVEIESLTDKEIMNMYNDIIQAPDASYILGYTWGNFGCGGTWRDNCPKDGTCITYYYCYIPGFGTFRNRTNHGAAGCWCGCQGTNCS